MASAQNELPKIQTEYLETVVGFVHNVSELKTSVKGTKYFNAILQLDLEEYHDVVVFSPVKREYFVQAQNTKRAVKLTNVSKTIDENYDVLCGRDTAIAVENVTFPRKYPLAKARMTVAEIQQLGSKYSGLFGVGFFVGRAVFINAVTQSVLFNGNMLQFQMCSFEDYTGEIEIQLWETHLGAILLGKTYRLSNLSTRHAGNVLSTTRNSQVEEVAPLEYMD